MFEQGVVFLSLSVALAMDAFAVSISLGAAGLATNTVKRFKIGLAFGFFQGLLFLIGIWSISLVNGFVSTMNQFIASGLLAFLGLKMVFNAFSQEKDACRHHICLGVDCGETKCNRTGQYRILTTRLLLIFAIATSIDAFAAGISYALEYDYSVVIIYYIGGITFVLSMIGAQFGEKLKHIIGNKSELIGGIILLLLAMKALL